MISKVCVSKRTPIIISAMLSIGAVAGLKIYTSEIIKRGETVKIPYMMFFALGTVFPPGWIWFSRYARYKHVHSIR